MALKGTIRSKIAGVSHNNNDGESRQELIRKYAKASLPLTLIPEPENPYSDTAVGIWLDTPAGRKQLGYIRDTDLDDQLSDYLQGGGILTCKIVEVTGQAEQTLGVNIQIDIPESNPQPAPATISMQAPAAPVKKKNPPFILILIGGLVALCVGCSVLTLIFPSSPTPEPTLDVNAVQTGAVETIFAEQTALAPASTSLPTNTPAPTDTPPPTLTPTPLPQPIVLSGTGDSVVDVQKWEGAAILKLSHSGGGNFIVYNVDAAGNQIDLLVNEIGAYQGTIPLDFFESEHTVRFEITAGGPWELQILPLAMMETFTAPGTYLGNGSNVLLIDSGGSFPDLLKVDASQASANFILYAYGDTRDLVVNEIAPYTGTVALDQSTVIISITATGPWSIEITTR